MYVSVRLLLLCVLFGAVFVSPIAVGAFSVLPYTAVAVAFVVFAAYAFGLARDRLSKPIGLVLL